VEKYGTANHARDENITRRTPFAYCITKVTDTEYEILLFHDNKGYRNTPQCDVTRILPLLLHLHGMKSLQYAEDEVSGFCPNARAHLLLHSVVSDLSICNNSSHFNCN
jgi:hypothetical protein